MARIRSGRTSGHRRRAVPAAAAAAALAALAVLASACGQIGAARSSGSAGGVEWWSNLRIAPAALRSPNGENSGPATDSFTYTVIVKKVTRVRRVGPPDPASNATAVVRGGTGPFLLCPVQGRGSYSDDFGAPRYAGGFHLHQGNDVFAPTGTPIVAPFDGVATRVPNSLGGLAVMVDGGLGHVYNAHLSAYGKAGPVRAGDVVGYVGNTGDAAGGPSHDHFEWHPRAIPPSPWTSPYGDRVIGTAVDPYPFLKAACSA
jgi:murein DD-endopeptidase MepM/ murein hydrolase activator NlpD